MKYDDFFRNHPVFMASMFKNYFLKDDLGGRGPESILTYYSQRGRLLNVRQGLYAVVPRGMCQNTFMPDPFLVAAKMTSDAVLSHHAALEFHGCAYSVWQHITYSAKKPPASMKFQQCTFKGTRFKEKLVNKNKEYFDVLVRDRLGMDVRVTSLERTFVDVLDRPDLSGSWEEIWRSLETIEYFDLDCVIDYVNLLENATTAAKVGFFLEQHRELLMVEESHIRVLRALCPRQPRYLDRVKRKSVHLVKFWNLIVPMEVYERAWGEVL